MRFSYVFLGAIAFLFIFHALPAHAAWPLNTPDAQTNPFWAGDNLVWNDDRLGDVDIFIRSSDGAIQPLIVAPSTQTLLGASFKAVFYADVGATTRIMLLDPKSRVLTQISSNTQVVTASVFDNQLAWSDGAVLWWWNGSKLLNRTLISSQFHLTPLGVASIVPSSVVLWSSSGDQTISCNCVDVSYVDDQLVLSGDASSTLWPSGTQIVARGQLQTNGHAIFYQKNGNGFLWRANKEYPYTASSALNVALGAHGIAASMGGDIVLTLVENPTVNVLSQPVAPNDSSYSGETNAALVRLTAASGSTSVVREVAVIDGTFQFENILENAADGTWTITVTAENAFGTTTIFKLAPVVIDRTPPQVAQEPELAASNDSVRIHWDTNEKADTGIVLATASDDEAKTRESSRLTFSHTATISDLDPDETYIAQLQSKDAAKNAVRLVRTFSTPSLLAAAMTISSLVDIKPKSAGIWEGKVVVEAGVIASDIMVVDFDYQHLFSVTGMPLLVEWTIGLPPEGIVRGAIVRIKGTLNSAGDRILAHRPKALAIVKTGDPPQILNEPTSTLNETKPFQWLELSGELTSVTKQAWKLQGSDVLLHWSTAPIGYKKGQKVTMQGYWYMEGVAPRFAAESARLLQDVVVLTTTVSSAAPVSVSTAPAATAALPSVVHYRTVYSTHTEVVAPAQTIQNQTYLEETSLESADFSTNWWYNTILMALGVAVYRRFFFSRH